MEGECVCSGLSLGCGEALVSCVFKHCAGVFVLKAVVVARLTCLFLTWFCAVGQFWVCGILVRGFCWAIAVCEYSFLLIFGFVCFFLGLRGAWSVLSWLKSAEGGLFRCSWCSD